jgi:GGDEF domain-containing protein
MIGYLDRPKPVIKERPMLGREHASGHPALTDSDTGLANLLHFELVFSYMFQAADRGAPLTVMLVSTPVTDPHLLRSLGETVGRTTRSADLVAHLGSGRFLVILLGTDLEGAQVAAARVRAALQEVAAGPVAIGIADYREYMKEPPDLLEAVDSAIRKAEEAGGGVELALAEPSE